MNQNTVTREDLAKLARTGVIPITLDVTALARACIELLHWQAGARENASDLACKVGADPENMDDAATWHATVKGIKELRSQKAALESQVDSLIIETDTKQRYYAELFAKYEKLESQLDEAQKDTERLDWLESHAISVCMEGHEEVWCKDTDTPDWDLRHDIDAAGALRAKPEDL